MNDYRVRVRVEGMARGSGEQPYLEFPAAQCVCTWSWGLQPATALIDWAVIEPYESALSPLALLAIDYLRGDSDQPLYTFYGICKAVAPTVSSEQGFSTAQEFVDSRELLQWDVMYCAFNKRESRLVDDGTGHFVWRRRYWHILPADFNAQRKTYTNGPLTARQIMDYLFASPTCESPWTRIYHPVLNQPVYDFDCLGGKKLGTCLVELSEALGAQFTLMGGRWNLVWCVRGVGEVPTAPDHTAARPSDQRRSGLSLSGNPTRIRILGDRDLYQVMNLEMEPDWLPAWMQFWNLKDLAADLFAHERLEVDCAGVAAGTRYNEIPDDDGQLIGWFLAQARARTITVGAYAALRDARDGSGQQFRDYRKFGGRSRLQMPAALYISTMLFRAFRPPRGTYDEAGHLLSPPFKLRNGYGEWLDLWSLNIVEQGLVEVTHDPATGEMEWEVDVISATNGYAIYQGYQAGQDMYKTLRPERFQVNQWLDSQNTWQHATFQVDDSGEGTEFIIFDAPVVKSGDLIRASADGGRYCVINAAPNFLIPRVRAALVFAAEPYSYIAGFGTKDDVVRSPGLGAQFVVEADSTALTELPYADGLTANDKAAGIAASLLNQQFTYYSGGYLVQGLDGTQLSSTIGRITVRHGPDGTSQEVDFANERDRNVSPMPGGGLMMHVPPERDFDRRAQLMNLLPGQRELREEARQMRVIGASLRQNPALGKTMLESFYMAFGLNAMPVECYVDPSMLDLAPSSGVQPRLRAGTPLFRESGEKVVASPLGELGDVTLSDPVFAGVTVLDGQAVSGPLHATAGGDDGVIYARVQGPVKTNDSVGLPQSGVVSYLTNAPRLAVGNALEGVPADLVALIPVRVGGTGEGGTGETVQAKIKKLYAKPDSTGVCTPHDYFSVVKWDGKNEGGKVFYAAKSNASRMVASELVDGVGLSYTYSDDNHRVSSSPMGNEIQCMLPRFVEGEIIKIQKVDHSGVNGPEGELQWELTGTEREWVKPYPDPGT